MRFKVFIFLCLHTFFSPIQAQLWQAPQPISSNKIIQAYFAEAFHYPETVTLKKSNGKIIISFHVDTQGNTTDFQVVKGQDEQLIAEAIRLARKILWKPAIRNGSPVESQAEIVVPYHSKQRLKQTSPIELNVIQYPILSDTSNKIYTFANVDQLPHALLPPKYRNLNQYIASSLKYPESAIAAGIEGVVQLGLIVEEDGLSSNIHIINSVGGGCDQEAIRILQSIKWVPAIKDSLYVRSQSQIEVAFRLKEHQQQQIPNRQSGSL